MGVPKILCVYVQKALTNACCRTGFPLRSKPAANESVDVRFSKIISSSVSLVDSIDTTAFDQLLQ